MKRNGFFVLKILIVVGLLVLAWVFYVYLSGAYYTGRTGEGPLPTATQESPSDAFTASFEIYTNGTRRVFTAAMYHNQSEDAYLESSNPSIVHVQKTGITWQEFFDTLPFKLSSDCLTTGTGQTFCTAENGTLKFFLNEDERPDALYLSIKPGDNLRVVYE